MTDTVSQPTLDEILAEALGFHRSFDSLIMATTSVEGAPTASYAPYVTDDEGCFYVYVSELAAHTANLLGNGRVSVLFIEDEREARQLFARRRLTCSCNAEEIGRGEADFGVMLDALAARHGGVVAMLREMADFHLFRLRPAHASFVRGFAQAYELNGETLSRISHVNDKGHR